MLSRPRKFALLVSVPFVSAALEYVFLPSYAPWRSTSHGLPLFTVVEAAAIAVPAAIVVGLVRRRTLFLVALLVLAGATSIGVWVAPGIPDGEGGLVLLIPFYVGVPVALGLGALDWLVGSPWMERREGRSNGQDEKAILEYRRLGNGRLSI